VWSCAEGRLLSFFRVGLVVVHCRCYGSLTNGWETPVAAAGLREWLFSIQNHKFLFKPIHGHLIVIITVTELNNPYVEHERGRVLRLLEWMLLPHILGVSTIHPT
jgi:hypothetical protein